MCCYRSVYTNAIYARYIYIYIYINYTMSIFIYMGICAALCMYRMSSPQCRCSIRYGAVLFIYYGVLNIYVNAAVCGLMGNIEPIMENRAYYGE